MYGISCNIPYITERDNMKTQLQNLNEQVRISDVINVLMAQSLQLMDIVNKNQKEINKLKMKLEQKEDKQPELPF